MPGASKNSILQHTETWHKECEYKGTGRSQYIPHKSQDKERREGKPRLWLDENDKPYLIDWYEIYGLLGEVRDWGEQKLRWSYYAHGRDNIGNEYWYASDQGGHIQSGTGSFRFKPAE